jgi:hypothetical protein
MRYRFVLIGLLTFVDLGFTQAALSQQRGAGGNEQKTPSAPAPRHDLSGIWAPARGPGAGIQPNGVASGGPLYSQPYTPLGLKTMEAHKPLYGQRAVFPSTLSDDPRAECNPLGFPRADFYQIRYEQFMQNDREIVLLYEYEKRWRSIWLDRELPKEVPEPRWYGYSVGKWVDDTTLEVHTVGVFGEPKAWLDETGRPISDDAKVEEQFHRVDHDTMEWTVTIDDPKMYSKPWVAMDKFQMKLQSSDLDIWGKYQVEMICSPTEVKEYNDSIGYGETEGTAPSGPPSKPITSPGK